MAILNSLLDRIKDVFVETEQVGVPAVRVKISDTSQTNSITGNSEIRVSLFEFNTNNIEEASATVTYIGTETSDGTYLIKKIDTSSGTAFSYASILNNPTRTTYTLAWTNKATLTYSDYSGAI